MSKACHKCALCIRSIRMFDCLATDSRYTLRVEGFVFEGFASHISVQPYVCKYVCKYVYATHICTLFARLGLHFENFVSGVVVSFVNGAGS